MSVVIEVIAPRLLGPALMVALALIVKGYTDVGDGFSAGVIVALAIALRYIALGRERAERSLPILRHAPRRSRPPGCWSALAVGVLPGGARRPAVHPPAAARRAGGQDRHARARSPRSPSTSGCSCSSPACS